MAERVADWGVGGAISASADAEDDVVTSRSSSNCKGGPWYGVETGTVLVRPGRGVWGADAVGTVALVSEDGTLVLVRLPDLRGGILVVTVGEGRQRQREFVGVGVGAGVGKVKG